MPVDRVARGLAARAGTAAGISAAGGALSTNTTRQSRLNLLLSTAEKAFTSNLRTRGVMTSPPTITDEGSSLPIAQSNGILRSAGAGFYQETGGAWQANGRYRALFISSGSESYNYARVTVITEDVKTTLRLGGTTAKWRFIVDGQYVDMTGTTPGGSSGTRYVTLDFTSAGGRAQRTISVELQDASGFQGAYVSSSGRLLKAPTPALRSVSLADSYVQGAAATARGDGLHAVMADYLGLSYGHMNSGSGGTGWVANSGGTVYNFLERIQNGDAALNGTPDIIFLSGSVNDKNSSAAAITANVLAGLQLLRASYPNAVITVFGVWPALGGANGTLSIALNEAAVLAGVTAFNDPLTAWVAINGAAGQTPLSGSGWVGNAYSGPLTFTGALVAAESATLNATFAGPTASTYSIIFSDGTTKNGLTLTNGSTAVSWIGAVTASASAAYSNALAGNADYIMNDNTHLNTTGCAYEGKWQAAQAISALRALLSTFG